MIKNESLKEANKLFQENKYQSAIEIYQKIVEKGGVLSDIAKQNIFLAQMRISNQKKEKIKTNFIENKKLDYYKDTEAYCVIDAEIQEYINTQAPVIANPLVSIVIPARNAEFFIESCLDSLKKQTYKNIEIIVIDDFSNDATQNLVLSAKRTDNRIKYYRINENLGTYFARSYGASKAKGEFITFQDADDVSHHRRIELHLSISINGKYLVTTSNYSRFDSNTGEILVFHGKKSHYGFITTFIHKSIFKELGSFDFSTRSGDVEFSTRIARNLEKSKIKHIEISTYLAADRVGSLSYNEVNRNEENKKKSLSFPRKKYIKNFEARLSTFKKDQLKEIFKFPMLRSAYDAPNEIIGCGIISHKIIGFMATIPERRNIFNKALETILPQVDFLYIYPDKYELNKVNFSSISKKIRIIDTKKHPKLRDASKFIGVITSDYPEVASDSIVFTFDDDIAYPPDYVSSLYRRLKKHNFRCIVGVHGVILSDFFNSYLDDRKVFHFKKELATERFVDVLGTGTTAFKGELLRGLVTKEELNPGMVDLSLATIARKFRIPMICIERPKAWLSDLTVNIEDETNASLWDETKVDPTKHNQILKSLGNVWGEFNIKQIIINSHKYISPNKDHWQNCTLSHIPKILSSITIETEKGIVGRIKIHIKNKTKKEFLIEVKNAINNSLIYERNTQNLNAAFIINTKSNEVFRLIIKEEDGSIPNEDLVFDIKFEKYYDISPNEKLKTTDLSITAAFATYPARENCAPAVIESILPQVNHLFVYLNSYKNAPSYIEEAIKSAGDSPTLDYILDSTGSPKASGKFRWIDLKGYIFTLDDDLIYPDDYISHMIGWIEKFKRGAILGVLGTIFEQNFELFHKGKKSSIIKKWNYADALEEPRRVHLVGTGSLAFHSDLIKTYGSDLYTLLNYSKNCENANDELLAIFCKEKNIPSYIVPRKKNWLPGNKNMLYGIYEEHFNDDSLSSSVTQILAKASPWPKLD